MKAPPTNTGDGPGQSRLFRHLYRRWHESDTARRGQFLSEYGRIESKTRQSHADRRRIEVDQPCSAGRRSVDRRTLEASEITKCLLRGGPGGARLRVRVGPGGGPPPSGTVLASVP